MPRKPIKLGIKSFVLGDSKWNYMYAWSICLGAEGAGYIYKLIHGELLGDSSFDHRGFCVFMDAYFVSIKLFIALAARGIFAVGPTKLKRPEKKADKGSWPFQTYEKSDLSFLERGWRRVCSQVIEAPSTLCFAGRTLYAAVWKDNKAVTLLYTAFHSLEKVWVPRWVGSERRRRFVPSFLALVMYSTYMGAIDRIDKTVAYVNIRLGKCQQRYHRVIFFWYIASIGLHNLSVLFKWLYVHHIGDFDTFYKSKDRALGYMTWIQITLARALIQEGVARAAGQLPQGSRPHFMPKPMGRPPKDPAASAIPKRCEWKHGNDINIWADNRNLIGTLGYSHCKQCYQPLLPEAPGRPEQPGKRKQTIFGCAGCQVNLCTEACFKAFDHINRIPRRSLVVQFARIEPGSEVGSPMEPVQTPPARPTTAQRRQQQRAALRGWGLSRPSA